MSDTERYQQLMDRFTVNGRPDKDKTQKTLSEEFQLMLLLRTPDQTIQGIIDTFVERNRPQLEWLGNARQDDMLREAQASCNVDLSEWIGEE